MGTGAWGGGSRGLAPGQLGTWEPATGKMRDSFLAWVSLTVVVAGGKASRKEEGKCERLCAKQTGLYSDRKPP